MEKNAYSINHSITKSRTQLILCVGNRSFCFGIMHAYITVTTTVSPANQTRLHFAKKEPSNIKHGNLTDTNQMHASVFAPLMVMAHDPQMPSRHDRRNVNVGSISFLILMRASRTIGPQSLRSTSYDCMCGLSPGWSGFCPRQKHSNSITDQVHCYKNYQCQC